MLPSFSSFDAAWLSHRQLATPQPPPPPPPPPPPSLSFAPLVDGGLLSYHERLKEDAAGGDSDGPERIIIPNNHKEKTLPQPLPSITTHTTSTISTSLPTLASVIGPTWATLPPSISSLPPVGLSTYPSRSGLATLQLVPATLPPLSSIVSSIGSTSSVNSVPLRLSSDSSSLASEAAAGSRPTSRHTSTNEHAAGTRTIPQAGHIIADPNLNSQSVSLAPFRDGPSAGVAVSGMSSVNVPMLVPVSPTATTTLPSVRAITTLPETLVGTASAINPLQLLLSAAVAGDANALQLLSAVSRNPTVTGLASAGTSADAAHRSVTVVPPKPPNSLQINQQVPLQLVLLKNPSSMGEFRVDKQEPPHPNDNAEQFVYYSSLEEELRMENLRKRKEEEERKRQRYQRQAPQSESLEGDAEGNCERRHKRFKKDQSQVEILEEAFKNNPLPTKKMKEKLALEAGLTPRAVQVWFQNRRAKERRQSKDVAEEEAHMTHPGSWGDLTA